MNLQAFCDPTRQTTKEPWSAGAYTYATDGKVCIRVARKDDVPEKSGVPTQKIDEWLSDGNLDQLAARRDLRPLPSVTLPKPKVTECERCNGRGVEHDCPECGCECSLCQGVGNETQRIIVKCGGVMLTAGQWCRLASLPGIQIATQKNTNGHAWFEFEGGRGIASPVRYAQADDAVVDANQQVPA